MIPDHARVPSRLKPRLTSIARSLTARISAGRSSRRRWPHAGPALALRRATTAKRPARTIFTPNAFIRIERDGQIVLTMPYVEMGQGTYTSIPMLIAEELEVDLSQVRLEHAPPNEKLYANPLLGHAGNRQLERDTRGVEAAARSRCDRENHARRRRRQSAGMSIRRPAARKAVKYFTRRRGEASSMANLPPTPRACPSRTSVALKRPEDFKLIGTPAKRLDTPAKVNGTAVYGIDVRPPGMKIATLAQSPVFGGRVKSVDDAAAKAVKGVRQIVRLDDAVAVVADHMGGREERAGGPSDRVGRRARTRNSAPTTIRGRARKGDAQAGGGRAEHRRCRQSHGQRRHARSRPPTRFPSSRTRRWSR